MLVSFPVSFVFDALRLSLKVLRLFFVTAVYTVDDFLER